MRRRVQVASEAAAPATQVPHWQRAGKRRPQRHHHHHHSATLPRAAPLPGRSCCIRLCSTKRRCASSISRAEMSRPMTNWTCSNAQQAVSAGKGPNREMTRLSLSGHGRGTAPLRHCAAATAPPQACRACLRPALAVCLLTHSPRCTLPALPACGVVWIRLRTTGLVRRQHFLMTNVCLHHSATAAPPPPPLYLSSPARQHPCSSSRGLPFPSHLAHSPPTVCTGQHHPIRSFALICCKACS